jgi:peroxiredoxin Q/BCP
MSETILGSTVADLSLHLTGDQPRRLSDYQGKNLVLYFYPKASTPGCTMEGQAFNAALAAFEQADCVVLGASRDSLKAQENFKSKQGFAFDLVSDPEGNLCQLFDVIQLKRLYGREYLGIERSTFLIDSHGRLQREWRAVKVKGHVDEVLHAARSLQP